MVDRRDLRNRLASLAAQQSGYFTAAQALELGYGYSQHSFHAAQGNWVRVGRGLYRLPQWPVGRHDDLVRASLRAGGRGVVSHESAAAYHGLGEIDPLRTHLTVPRTFRSTLSGVVLHRLADLNKGDIEDEGAFRVTTPARTLVDLGRSGVDVDQLGRAIQEALDRHLVTLRDLRSRAERTDLKSALAIERALAQDA